MTIKGSKVFKYVLRVFKGCCNKMKGSFKHISRKFMGRFKIISCVFQESFKGVSRVFYGFFKEVSMEFQVCLQVISNFVFQRNVMKVFKAVSCKGAGRIYLNLNFLQPGQGPLFEPFFFRGPRRKVLGGKEAPENKFVFLIFRKS